MVRVRKRDLTIAIIISCIVMLGLGFIIGLVVANTQHAQQEAVAQTLRGNYGDPPSVKSLEKVLGNREAALYVTGQYPDYAADFAVIIDRITKGRGNIYPITTPYLDRLKDVVDESVETEKSIWFLPGNGERITELRIGNDLKYTISAYCTLEKVTFD